jgi:hypothetical protein
MQHQSHDSASPLINWAAISSGALVGLAVAVVADALWTAAAFSSHNSAFYNHLAWWYGGTLIGAVLLGAAAGAAMSTTRGVLSGAANGLTVGAFILLVTGAVGVVVAVSKGATATLAVGGSTVHVGLARPYVAFWASLFALAAGAIGGTAGGVVPRRDAAAATTVSGMGRTTGLEAASSTNARRSSEAAAS